MKLVPYLFPHWFESHHLVQKHFKHVAKKIPRYRIELLSKPTPIQKIVSARQSCSSLVKTVSSHYELLIKRDDLTHRDVHMQGNKLRKLEFIFAQVLSSNAKHVLTAGGLQSNHCRTVAAVAAQLGLQSHLFLRSPHSDATQIEINGNTLIDLMLGARIYLIERGAQYYANIEPKMKILASKLKEPSYLIPVGGSNLLGIWGYIEMFDELISSQKADQLCDDICVTCGSGSTMSGLAIANYLTGSKFRLHAFCVCDSSSYFYSHLENMLKELFGLDSYPDLPELRDMVNIVQCSKGLGYAKSTQDELNFQVDFFRKTGIMLDPVYTGKMVYSLFNLLEGRKPTLGYEHEGDFVKRLKGNRIMLIHTGGQLANFEPHRFDEFCQYERRGNVFDCFGDKIDSIQV